MVGVLPMLALPDMAESLYTARCDTRQGKHYLLCSDTGLGKHDFSFIISLLFKVYHAKRMLAGPAVHVTHLDRVHKFEISNPGVPYPKNTTLQDIRRSLAQQQDIAYRCTIPVLI